MIKENKRQIKDFKANGGYEIIPATSDPLNSVTVDLVLQDLFEEEELAEEDSDVESDAYDGDESESGSDEDWIDLESKSKSKFWICATKISIYTT